MLVVLLLRVKKSSKNKLDFYKCRLAEGFSGPGQTQEISLAALIVARMAEGVGSVQHLRKRLVELVTNAPGFQQHCDHKQEIETGRFWSQATLKNSSSFRRQNMRIPGDKFITKSGHEKPLRRPRTQF